MPPFTSNSIEIGPGVLAHNNRKFIADNVDKNRTQNNLTYRNMSLEEAYHMLFDDALERYNDRQKRADRKIDNYLEHIQKGKQEKPFYEIIVQVGNREDMGIGTGHEWTAQKILIDYINNFEKRNPNLFVFNSVLHMDEATPHLHIDFIPFITESKRGLDTRVSLKKALEQQGFKGTGRSDTEAMAWLHSEREVLGATMFDYGVTWGNQGNNLDHLSVSDFKKKQRMKEVAELDAEVDSLKAEVENLTQTIEKVEIMTSDEEFEEEFALPEPQRLESAKSYKNRIESVFEKLKTFVKNIFVELMKARNEISRLNNKVDFLKDEISDLTKSNENFQRENQKLNKQLKDYRIVRKVFGNEAVDRALEQEKTKPKFERIRNYEKDGVYLR